jgi:hypothetical protein
VRTILVAFSILIVSLNCLAQRDGNAVLHECNAAVDHDDGVKQDAVGTTEALACISYVAGYLDAFRVLRVFDSTPGAETRSMFCIPDTNVSTTQVVRIFAKYLHGHPEHLDANAAILLTAALREAFPCGSKP